MIVQWTESVACTSGNACRVCRNLAGGREFRESLGRVFALPDGAPDFECPHGKPWGCRGPAAIVSGSQQPDAWAECDECDHQDWPSGGARSCNLIDGCTPCRLGALLRAGGPWPDGCPRKTKE